jgi:alginate O-acetyltransferase complex protein AlgJ
MGSLASRLSRDRVASVPVEGRVQAVIDGRVVGWGWRPERPGDRLELEVLVDDAVVARGRAELSRADLRRDGVGDGAHCFRIELPSELAVSGSRSIDVRVASTGERLVFNTSYRVTTKREDHPFARTIFVPVRRARTQAQGSGARALLGRDGWLFLMDDTNDTLEQLAGTRTLSEQDIRAHVDALVLRRERLAALGVAPVFALAPMKERVYRELLPDGLPVRDELRPARLLAEALRGSENGEPLDLLPVLRDARSHGEVYPRTDHHWNSRGAFFAAQALLREAHTQLPCIPPLSADAMRFIADPFFGGDLAEKPKVAIVDGAQVPVSDEGNQWSEVVERVDPRGLRARTVTPEPHLHVSPTRAPAVFERPDAAHLPRCLLVGDSFCLALLPWLAESFSRLAFVWTADPPLDLVELERPDLLLQVKSERFLLARPDAG